MSHLLGQTLTQNVPPLVHKLLKNYTGRLPDGGLDLIGEDDTGESGADVYALGETSRSRSASATTAGRAGSEAGASQSLLCRAVMNPAGIRGLTRVLKRVLKRLLPRPTRLDRGLERRPQRLDELGLHRRRF